MEAMSNAQRGVWPLSLLQGSRQSYVVNMPLVETLLACRGKRVGVFGAFLLAIYDEDNEEYQAISKIGTGFSEVLLKDLADSLREHIIDGPRPYYRYVSANDMS